ncbi:hypothetical protein AB0J83_23160 [Actinoplanes sp. NPDC049596]|uniref:hypothetical protein n=1 Tax=unclassified Actinoplanes TaxID=2626549 RepID=UPI0034360471
MIDTVVPAWDPPPRRPGLTKAYAAMALALVTTIVLAVGGLLALNAAVEAHYPKVADACPTFDPGPVMARLGVSEPELEPSKAAPVCRYRVAVDGQTFGAGQFSVTHHDNAAVAGLYWQVQDTDDGRIADLAGIGRAARFATEREDFRGLPTCAAYLYVLDSNVTVLNQITVIDDLPAHPCRNLDALKTALVDSTRTTLAKLGDA